MNIDKLTRLCFKAEEYITKNTNTGTELSPMWDQILNDRPNFPKAKDFLTFLRNNYTAGVGSYGFNEEKDQEYFSRIVSHVKAYGVTDEFIQKIHEPIFGSPYFFEYDSKLFSANYLRNIVNAYIIYNKFKDHKNITILEIGAGYGVLANILHQLLDIDQYVIIDLSENLYLSSVYLQTTLEKPITYISDSKKADTPLVQCLPEYIDQLNINVDLVINTNSFGEMPHSVVENYLILARRLLKPHGLIYSHNRIHTDHNETCANFSDYIIDGLRLDQIHQSPCNTHLDYHLHHIVFVAKGENHVPVKYLNVLGELAHSGLLHHITKDIENILMNNCTNEEEEFLNLLAVFFAEKNIQKKYQILKEGSFVTEKFQIIIFHFMILLEFTSNNLTKMTIDNYIKLNSAKHYFDNYDSILILLIAVKSKFYNELDLLNGIKSGKLSHYYNDIIDQLSNQFTGRYIWLKQIISFIIPSFKSKALKSFLVHRFLQR